MLVLPELHRRNRYTGFHRVEVFELNCSMCFWCNGQKAGCFFGRSSLRVQRLHKPQRTGCIIQHLVNQLAFLYNFLMNRLRHHFS